MSIIKVFERLSLILRAKIEPTRRRFLTGKMLMSRQVGAEASTGSERDRLKTNGRFGSSSPIGGTEGGGGEDGVGPTRSAVRSSYLERWNTRFLCEVAKRGLQSPCEPGGLQTAACLRLPPPASACQQAHLDPLTCAGDPVGRCSSVRVALLTESKTSAVEHWYVRRGTGHQHPPTPQKTHTHHERRSPLPRAAASGFAVTPNLSECETQLSGTGGGVSDPVGYKDGNGKRSFEPCQS